MFDINFKRIIRLIRCIKCLKPFAITHNFKFFSINGLSWFFFNFSLLEPIWFILKLWILIVFLFHNASSIFFKNKFYKRTCNNFEIWLMIYCYLYSKSFSFYFHAYIINWISFSLRLHTTSLECVYYGKISSELALTIGLQKLKSFNFIKFVDKLASVYTNYDTWDKTKCKHQLNTFNCF